MTSEADIIAIKELVFAAISLSKLWDGQASMWKKILRLIMAADLSHSNPTAPAAQ